MTKNTFYDGNKNKLSQKNVHAKHTFLKICISVYFFKGRDIMDDKIKKLYMNGFTYIEIAKQLNTSEIKIKHIIDIRLNNYKELHLRNKLKG